MPASVKLDTGVKSKVATSLLKASAVTLPDRVYLKLENIRGTFDAAVLGVYVNLPDGAKPGASQECFAGSMALFGLRRASIADGEHAGEGLTFLLDITHRIDDLHLAGKLDSDSLRVSLVPTRALPERSEITVGRISVFRQAS